MPSQLAALVVFLFIFFVIYVEHRQSRISGPIVWIISVWILYSSSKGLGVFLNNQTTIEAGSLPDRYFQLALGILALIILIKRNFSFIFALKQNMIIFVIITYSFLTILWSKYPEISFRRWGREIIAVIIAFLMVSENYPLKIFFSATKRAIYAALPISILLIKYFSYYGREYNRWTGEVSWVGIASQKNSLAMLCAFSIIFLLWSIRERLLSRNLQNTKLLILIDLIMIMMAIYLIMGPQTTLTYSATSFIAVLIGLLFIFISIYSTVYKINLTRVVFILAIIIILFGTMIPFTGKIPFKVVPKLVNRSETLTDRTEIWSLLIPFAKKKILFGYGYGGFWTTHIREEIESHSHNGYLETILNLGLFGLILFSLFLIISSANLAKMIIGGNNDYIPFLSIIFMYLIYNISESFLGDFQSLMSITIIFVSTIINKESFQYKSAF